MPQAPTGADDSPAAPKRRAPHILRALRHRNYQIFFGGQLISLVGTWMQQVAQAWLVYRLTGSSLLLGLVGFASQIPVCLLAPLGGAAADRVSRRSILLGTQIASMLLAALLAALTLTGHISIPLLFGLAAALGAVNAFDIPARQAFVVEMVGREDLINAIALNSSMFNGARVIGPAVAGVLVGAIGEGFCFLLNAVSFLAVIAGLLLMRVRRPRPRASNGASALADIAEGFRFVSQTRPIRGLLLLLGVVSLTAVPYAVLMPIFADQVLNGGASGLGLLMGASGSGAVLGALMLAARTSLTGLGTWIAASSAAFGASLVLFSLSRSFWLSAALLVPAGFAMMIQMAGTNTLVQRMVPDALRGRVMAVYSMMFMGAAPIGAVLAGALADRIGAPLTVGAGGVVCVLAAGVFATQLPGLRGPARELILAQQAESAEPPQTVP